MNGELFWAQNGNKESCIFIWSKKILPSADVKVKATYTNVSVDCGSGRHILVHQFVGGGSWVSAEVVSEPAVVHAHWLAGGAVAGRALIGLCLSS